MAELTQLWGTARGRLTLELTEGALIGAVGSCAGVAIGLAVVVVAILAAAVAAPGLLALGGLAAASLPSDDVKPIYLRAPDAKLMAT